MDHRINSLFLVAVNEGGLYPAHCRAARVESDSARAVAFAKMAGKSAAYMCHTFGDSYTAAEILRTAIELESYYVRHVLEIARCDEADSAGKADQSKESAAR